MAWTSLIVWGVMALVCSGCLVTESPTFTAPRRTPPFLTNLKPTPSVAQEIELEPGTENLYRRDKYIHFDILSEDLGQTLTAFVVLDFKDLYRRPPPRTICEFRDIPPGTLLSERPPFSCQLDFNPIVPRVEHSCHSISVVASHRFVALSLEPVDPQDVAVASWIYQVGVDPTEPDPDKKYKPCIPDPTPDAGADVRADRGGF